MRHIRGKSDLKQKLNFKLELDGPAEREACLQHSCPSSQDTLLWLLMQWQPLGFSATSFLDKRSTVGYSITPNPDPLISVQSGFLMPGAGHLLGCPPTPTGFVNILKCILLEWGNGLYQVLELGLLGLTPFPPVLGTYRNSIYPFSTEMSLCVWDPTGGLLFAEGFFACKENFAITEWKLLFGRMLVLVQTSESLQVTVFNKVTGYPHICSDEEMSESSWAAFCVCPL